LTIASPDHIFLAQQNTETWRNHKGEKHDQICGELGDAVREEKTGCCRAWLPSTSPTSLSPPRPCLVVVVETSLASAAAVPGCPQRPWRPFDRVCCCFLTRYIAIVVLKKCARHCSDRMRCGLCLCGDATWISRLVLVLCISRLSKRLLAIYHRCDNGWKN
jgi:hypothetical protein